MRRWSSPLSVPIGLGVVAALLCVSPAAADSNHYVNLLVGDRATGMAGAYTAVADDASGLYYNPAGIVYIGNASLSASMNAFRYSETRYRGAGAVGGRGWERRSSSLVPNFFGVVQPVGDLFVGFSYAVPDSVQTDQDQEFRDLPGTNVARYRINFNENDTTYNVGPSLALRAGKRLAVGLTLYGHYRQREFISNQLVELRDGTFQSLGQYVETDEYGVRPLLGAVLEISDSLACGVSLSRTYLFDSESRGQDTVKNPGDEAISEVVVHSGSRREYPYRLALGAAWFPSEAFLLSADLTYHSATADDTFGDRDATWNGALGLEYFLTRTWAIRGGVFSDRGNTPAVEKGKTDQLEHVDLYGVTGSITHHTTISALTLGASYRRGSGDAQIVGGSTSVQDVTSTGLTVYVSASYRY